MAGEICKDLCPSHPYNCPPFCQLPSPALPYPPNPLPLPFHHQSHKNPSHLITTVAFLSAVFLLVILCYIILKCQTCRNTTRRPTPPTNNTLEDHHIIRDIRRPGLEESVIDSIAVSKYKRGGDLIQETKCSICLNEFCDDENLRLLPNCIHAFHPSCIDTWLKSNENCPLCRSSVISTPMSSAPRGSSPSSDSQDEPQNHIVLGFGNGNGHGAGGDHRRA